MPLPLIRTITLGLEHPHAIPGSVIQRVSTTLHHARMRFRDAGYEVQTVRVSTQPIWNQLKSWPSRQLFQYVQELQQMLDDVGLQYCSLGPARPAPSSFPVERFDLIADILIATHSLNATVALVMPDGLDLKTEAALPTARIIQRLAQETEQGLGNFRFAMLAGVPAWGPFFPAAYHEGSAPHLGIGLQGASIVVDALRAYTAEATLPLDPTFITQCVGTALIEHMQPIVTLADDIAREYGIPFAEFDLSPAPMGGDSIAAAIELCGYGPIGSPGTLAVVAALTAALKSTDFITCGYNGLMLPVLEDAVLAKRWAEGHINVHQLLLFSAVCGTGLDTIPLPGDITTETIAQLLLDVAILAQRLKKPLSARLFPAPGKRAGERTTFTSPYLTNTLIRAII